MLTIVIYLISAFIIGDFFYLFSIFEWTVSERVRFVVVGVFCITVDACSTGAPSDYHEL